MTEEEKKVAFLPYHAINEFMLDDYRLRVIRGVLQALPGLPENLRLPVEELTRKLVRVPGFRNSLKAPVPLKVKPMADAFKTSPQLVAALLAAWSENQLELRQKVYDLLKARGWELLPPEADRSMLPGFLTKWLKGENFEVLNEAFNEMYPGTEVASDDVSLMVVWLSGRLPYQFDEEDEAESEEEGAPDL